MIVVAFGPQGCLIWVGNSSVGLKIMILDYVSQQRIIEGADGSQRKVGKRMRHEYCVEGIKPRWWLEGT